MPHATIVSVNSSALAGSRPPDLVNILLCKAFVEAEELINENPDPEYLNERSYNAVPILLVVSGTAGFRNLRLAKLLAERGADVNPMLCFVTPLEHLVNLFLSLMECTNDDDYVGLGEVIIGLGGEINPPLANLKAQLLTVIDVFLAHNARPVRAQFYKAVAVEEPNMDLVMMLHEAGGSFDMEDRHGTTPLMEHITIATRDAALPLVKHVLSLNTNLNLNRLNCCGETLLWRAMLAGSSGVAIALLENGANPHMGVPIDFTCRSPRLSISPLFAPLLRVSALYEMVHSNSFPDLSFSVVDLDRVMSPVFHVVDRTDIGKRIFPELHSFMAWKTNFPISCLVNREISEEDVPNLMLGRNTCGLQQLCVRAIMRHLLVNKRGIQRVIAETVKLFPQTITADMIIECSMFKLSWLGREWTTVVNLCPEIMEALVTKHLRLPRIMMEKFFIEAARYQLGAILYTAEFSGCNGSCDSDEDWAERSWFDRRDSYVYSSDDSSDDS